MRAWSKDNFNHLLFNGSVMAPLKIFFLKYAYVTGFLICMYMKKEKTSIHLLPQLNANFFNPMESQKVYLVRVCWKGCYLESSFFLLSTGSLIAYAYPYML